MSYRETKFDARGVLDLAEKRQLLAGIRLQFKAALAQNGQEVDPKTRARAARWMELAASIEEDLTRADHMLR